MAKTWVKVEKMLCFTSRTLNSLHCLFWSGSSKTLSKPSFGSHKFINGRIRSFKTQIRIVEKTRIHPDPDPKHWFTPLEFQRQTGFFLLYRLNDSFSLKWRKHFYNRKGFHEFAFAFSCFSYEKNPSCSCAQCSPSPWLCQKRVRIVVDYAEAHFSRIA